jgi:hypothetical protein
MHPVMLVFALDETEGRDLPEELKSFAPYQGQWNPDWLQRTVQNAAERDRIRVDFKILSSTNAGFATLAHSTGEWKMRIVSTPSWTSQADTELSAMNWPISISVT